MTSIRTILTTRDMYTGSLVLVNKAHPWQGQGREPLVPLAGRPGHCHGEILLAAVAARHMNRLLAEADHRGVIAAVSGYRSRQEQRLIYDETLRRRGEAYTSTYVALPGCSEHETGLALDVGVGGSDFITPAFPGRGAFARFKELAAGHGFIERYPKDKRHITGIGYEPWHYRYVGRPHALLMRREGLCLEEYIELLSGHMGPENALEARVEGRGLRIFTIPGNPADPGRATALEYLSALPENLPRQLSGNNVNGVVACLWQ